VLDDNIFILNQFKTAKKEGQKIIQIPDELRDNINIYLKFHPFIKLILSKKNNEPVPFLVNFKGQPINQINGITRILNRVFNKKISSSMLRHIYLSSKYNSVLEEQKKDSELMSHSLSTQKAYIKK
jgi:integrase